MNRKPWSALISLLVLLLTLLSLTESSLAATYAFRNQVFTYDTHSNNATTVTWHASGASPGCTTYPNGDDDWADITFPDGFTFTFNDINYSGVRIYSNGILAFGNDVSGFHRNWDHTAVANIPQALAGPAGCPRAVPVRLMLPYWTDIVAGTANGTTGASIKYELLTTGTERRLVISWDNVKLYNTTTRYNFQVALFESAAGVNGPFEYRYTRGSSNGANATVGLYLSSTDYMQYSYDQQFIDTNNGTLIHWYPAAQLLPKRSEYRFEEAIWAGIADEVKDTSGEEQHAQRVGNASNIADGKLCRGGSFPSNTSNTVRDAVATPALIGASGSVGFWYRSNTNWNAANSNAMLIDATGVANRPFFLMKRANGSLRFAVSDSAGTVTTVNTPNQNFAANTWQHIGITWGVRSGSSQTLLQVFINGTLAAFQRNTTTGTPATFSTMYIGDNRTSGVTPANGTPNSANGRIDEVYSYALDVSGPQFEADMALVANCASLDHFRIIHSGEANCGTAQVTIEAHDSTHNLFTLAGTTMTLSTGTNHGSWSTVTAINPINNITPGTATYTFSNENRVVLALNNPYIETLNINVAAGSITEHSGAAAFCSPADHTFNGVCDANLSFPRCVSAYECLASGVTYSNTATTPDSRNPLYTKLAGTLFNFDVVAVDMTGNRRTTHAADADKSVTVELVNSSIQTSDPSNVHPCDTLPALSPAASTALTYTKAGQATDQGRKAVSFTVNQAYQDVRCRVTDASTVPSLISCSSDNFSVRPPSLTVNSSNATNTGSSGTPIFKAGTDGFNLTVTAPVVGWTGTPKIGTTGMAGHTGAVTVGTLDPATFGAATTSGTFKYSEVGNFRFLGYAADAAGTRGIYDDTFTAVDSATGDCSADYSNTLVGGKFGCNFGLTANSALFGRFVPDHFTLVSTPVVTDFAYMGQPFTVNYTLEARNAEDIITSNYTGAYAPGEVSFAAENANNGTDLVARLAGHAAAWNSGSYGVATADNAKFARGGSPVISPDGPYDALAFGVKVTDSDGPLLQGLDMNPATTATDAACVVGGIVTNCTHKTIGTTKIRFGQMVLFPGYGSELVDLAMPIQIQYWDGSAFAINALDSSTTITDAQIGLTGLTPTPTKVAPSASTPLNFSAGKGILKLNSSGTIGKAQVIIDLSSLPYLLGNPAGATGYASNPTAPAIFGLSRKSNKVIFSRERY